MTHKANIDAGTYKRGTKIWSSTGACILSKDVE